MPCPHVWTEELREIPRDGGSTVVWIVRREGETDADPLRLLCAWHSRGQQVPLPLGLVLHTLQSGASTEQRDESRSRRPPHSLALPLRQGRRTLGALVAAGTDRAPWANARRLWAEAVAARLGPLTSQLEPWPGTWIGPARNAARPWQPSLFPVDALTPARSSRQPPGLLLPRPRAVAGLPGAVGRSGEIQRLADRVVAVAASGVNVLLLGETGTGKEIVARALHEGSDRAGRPFVGLNCAALPDTLFESELFGHRAGAFTGAARDKPGLLESAHGGTFFMDEIGDMPLPLQIKLLRVMQERKVRRVGELENRPVDIRFVAATHKNIVREIEAGRFRLDLYYRLKVVQLEIPALRERPEDVLPLLSCFLERADAGRRSWAIADDATASLHAWRWPGNVRELENEAARLVALHGDEPVIQRRHLSWEIQEGTGPRPASDDLGTLRRLEEANEMLERHLIRKAIAASAGRKSVAARTLGLSRQGLYKKIQRYRMFDLIGGDHATDELRLGAPA